MAADNSKFDIVAISASASGAEALKDLVWGLPADLPSASWLSRDRAADD
jgi:chemotaxis response regulator CheB